MSTEHESRTTTQNMALYHEYYAIKEAITINVVVLDTNASEVDDDAFLQAVPEVFRLAGQLHSVDEHSIAAVRGLGDNARLIADVLDQQNRKLNAVLGLLLSQQDDPEHRYHTLEYGGAGVCYLSDEELAEGTLAELKLFLAAEFAAVYSYARVIRCEPVDEKFRIYLLFEHITDDDRELLVRASLRAQSRLLKKRAAERNATAGE